MQYEKLRNVYSLETIMLEPVFAQLEKRMGSYKTM